jgi:hypothetical protein
LRDSTIEKLLNGEEIFDLNISNSPEPIK